MGPNTERRIQQAMAQSQRSWSNRFDMLDTAPAPRLESQKETDAQKSVDFAHDIDNARFGDPVALHEAAQRQLARNGVVFQAEA